MMNAKDFLEEVQQKYVDRMEEDDDPQKLIAYPTLQDALSAYFLLPEEELARHVPLHRPHPKTNQ